MGQTYSQAPQPLHFSRSTVATPLTTWRASKVQAAAQVVDLRAGDFRGVLEVLLLERAHQLGVRQKTVGVGQQNQRDG